ncbi:MAG TPA: zf-HC2 domain-containing protein, partial [Polyangiales bacterium]
MSVIEVHPEELLDRELRGELTERERVLLNAHLARCAPCRFERQLRADFETEHTYPLPASDLTDVIAGALRACDLPTGSEPGVRMAPTPAPGQHRGAGAVAAPAAAAGAGRGRLWRRALMALVACSVFGLGIGYAGAQLGLTHPGFSALLERVGVQVSSRPKARPARAHAPRVNRPAPSEGAATPSAQAPTPVLAPPALPLSKLGASAPARRALRAP